MKNLLTLLLCGLLLFGCSKNEVDDDLQEIYLYISQSDLIFSEDHMTDEIYIETNGQWQISGVPFWCECTPSTGYGDSQIMLTVNPEYIYEEDQNTNLTITAGTQTESVWITLKKKDALILSKDKYAVPLEGGTISIEVKSNISYDIIIPKDFSEWIEEVDATSHTRALKSRVHIFKIADNLKVPKDRDGYIIIDGGEIKETVYIFQNYENKLILGKDSYVLTSEAINLDIQLQTNVDYEITIPDDAHSWIRQIATRAIRTDVLHFDIAENTTSESRSAEIVIRDKNSDLKQILNISQMVKGVYPKDVVLRNDADVKEFGDHKYTKIEGNLTIQTDDVSELQDRLIEVEGDVIIRRTRMAKQTENGIRVIYGPKLTSFDGLYGLEKIGGSFIVSDADISSFEGLKNLHTIGGDFILEDRATADDVYEGQVLSVFKKLKSFEGLDALKTIGGDFRIEVSAIKGRYGETRGLNAMPLLESFEGFEALENIKGNFIIDVDGSNYDSKREGVYVLPLLQSFKGLERLKKIGKDFSISLSISNSSPESSVRVLSDLSSFRGLDNLESIGGNFQIETETADSGGNTYGLSELKSFEGLEKLSHIGGSILILGSNSRTDNYTYWYTLGELSSCLGFNNLTYVGENISIKNCISMCDYTALQSLLSSFTGYFEAKYNKYNPTKQDIIDGNGADDVIQ